MAMSYNLGKSSILHRLNLNLNLNSNLTAYNQRGFLYKLYWKVIKIQINRYYKKLNFLDTQPSLYSKEQAIVAGWS